MTNTNLTEAQKVSLKKLEPALLAAIKINDLYKADIIVSEIQKLLRPTGHETRLMSSKNRLFEAYMNNNLYEKAIKGFGEVRKISNKNTRLYLEASAMMAICYIRIADIDKAQPLISEVLKNEKVIKTPRRRVAFHKAIIQRFDEEGILAGLKGEGDDKLDADDIDKEVHKIFGLDEKEIFGEIGKVTPSTAVNILERVNDFSLKQLPSAERKLLPGPINKSEKEKIGKTVFSSIKQTLYNTLCNPQSDTYQAWFTNGMKVVLEKKYITTAVIATLTGLGIGIKAIATYVIALIIKFGIEVYCNHNKPDGIMDLRS